MCHSEPKFSSVQAIEWLAKPIAVSGLVQHGFGRGSRSLGTPTANLPGSLLREVTNASRDGVYLGFGRVPKFGDAVVKMVASIGHNITFGDVTERVLEAHLMSDIFESDFYGEEMRLCIVAFMRPELKFNSLQQLMDHIRNDISVANQALDLPQAQPYRIHPLLLK
ncbi:Riboflavin kinase [Gracilaria domingensis]|nr:Riboflavin kinase [Gracilaria domingensis]